MESKFVACFVILFALEWPFLAAGLSIPSLRQPPMQDGPAALVSREKRDLPDLNPQAEDESCPVVRDEIKFHQKKTQSVKKDLEYIYTLSYKEMLNKTTAVRIFVSAHNASEDFPVLFVVRQQRHILSWQVPLLLENVYDFYHVARTLCPLESDHKYPGIYDQQILIDVSTASLNDVSFTLEAQIVPNFEVALEEVRTLNVTPSAPQYFQYSFGPDVRSVVVHITSDDDLCMVVSVQDVECPVYDLVRNVEFTGEYQTVLQKGAITVQKKQFQSGAFFVVFVVKPHDYECTGTEKIQPPPVDGQRAIREKQLKFHVETAIPSDQYLGAVVGAVGWFLLFYVAAVIISLIYHKVDSPIDGYQEQLGGSSHGSNPQTPIVGPEGTPGTSYGATGGSPGQTMETDMRSGTFSKTTNGFPHRIAPPAADSDSEPELEGDVDYDMLNDADHEKDVFRTKAFLYVSDLARKDRKVLKKKYKLYHWNLLTISIFYALPVIQLVITYQTVLHVTGNEDICYYNFLCAHPLGVLSAFNNVFSNIGYMMLGLLFLALVLRKDLMYRKQVRQNERLEKYYGIPQHFGLFYAMGIALMMEGILSGCYHVCPSYSNFQFDTSFMYMIAWLCMLKIYQIRHPDINAQAHVAYFAIAFVIFIAVIGVVYGNLAFWIFFAFGHLTITVILTAQIYYMGRWRLDMGLFQRVLLVLRSDVLHCSRPLYPDRMILLIIGNAANWSLALYGLVIQPRDFATYLLAIFIVNLLMYYTFYIIMKLRSGERILITPLLFIIIAAISWGCGFYFFFARLTSWQEMAAQSRVRNQRCLLLGFYDEHDIWHFLSSMSLFFSFMVLVIATVIAFSVFLSHNFYVSNHTMGRDETIISVKHEKHIRQHEHKPDLAAKPMNEPVTRQQKRQTVLSGFCKTHPKARQPCPSDPSVLGR